MFEVNFYRLPNGKIPVKQFLDSREKKMRSKALDSLTLLAEYGSQMREPYSKAMGNGIFELRIKFFNDISRIFYFFYSGKKIIVTNGFIKKTQKTPEGELALAKKYKLDYEQRNKGGVTHE